jgi:hypothetical protein
MFIPAAVLERARELVAATYDFSTVVRLLEREGNGTWPRKTLMRRIRSTSRSATPARGHNRASSSTRSPAAELLERVAKTPSRTVLEFAVAHAERMHGLDSLSYRQAVAALEGLSSNQLVRRPRGPRR